MKRLIGRILCKSIIRENEELRRENSKLIQLKLGIIKSIQKTKIEEGDVVVLKTEELISEDGFKCTKKAIMEGFKGKSFKPKVLLLDGGLDIQILSFKDSPKDTN